MPQKEFLKKFFNFKVAYQSFSFLNSYLRNLLLFQGYDDIVLLLSGLLKLIGLCIFVTLNSYLMFSKVGHEGSSM